MKTKVGNHRIERLRNILGFNSYFVVKSIGKPNGVALFWYDAVDVSLFSFFSLGHIDVTLSWSVNDIFCLCYFIALYDSLYVNLRSAVWKLLNSIGSNRNTSRCVVEILLRFCSNGRNRGGQIEVLLKYNLLEILLILLI